MSRLTRDGAAETVSRDQFSGTNADRGKFIFPVQLTTSRIGNLPRLIYTLAICDDDHIRAFSVHLPLRLPSFVYFQVNTGDLYFWIMLKTSMLLVILSALLF